MARHIMAHVRNVLYVNSNTTLILRFNYVSVMICWLQSTGSSDYGPLFRGLNPDLPETHSILSI